jgi:predicted phage terminase large subunit-like protein
MSEINPEDIDFLLRKIKDQAIRREITKHSHLLFFHIYLSRYVECEMAPFHQDFFAITEDENLRFAVIAAFRGSAKSTIMNLSFALWAILGIQQKKFVVLISQTQELAKQHFKNLKDELEGNPLLKADLGPFQEQDEWSAGSIVIPRYNAKIIAASSEQSIRGIIYGPHRPDLIICDDIEDSDSVRTQDSRKRTYEWFNSEIVPLGNTKTKIIVIGNILHPESLIMKVRKEIHDKTREGTYLEYPLINDQGQCLWLGKYPNQKEIDRERLKAGNEFFWNKEYLLKYLEDHEAVIHEDWLHFYRDLPEVKDSDSSFAIGIDLAISETGDFTAMVLAKIIPQEDGTSTIYILPNPINDHLTFPEILDHIKTLVAGFGGRFSTSLYVEEAFLQGYLTQFLEDTNFMAEGFKVHGMDKKTRLIMTTHYIQTGKILFPEKGAGTLIDQLLHFNSSKHDDLVDAFTVLILKIIEKDSEPMPNIILI